MSKSTEEHYIIRNSYSRMKSIMSGKRLGNVRAYLSSSQAMLVALCPQILTASDKVHKHKHKLQFSEDASLSMASLEAALG